MPSRTLAKAAEDIIQPIWITLNGNSFFISNKAGLALVTVMADAIPVRKLKQTPLHWVFVTVFILIVLNNLKG